MLRKFDLALGAVMVVAAPFSMARAADAPLIGPAPAWVLPAPPLSLAPHGVDPSGARVLLQDTQVNFTGDGFSSYVHTIVRLDSPQALAAMGTVALPWRPSSDVLTLHKINIRRGDQSINALDKEKLVVLRRENNLEAAMLDGVLTATLQIESLQVGDIVEMETSILHADPVLKGAADATGFWTPGPHADRMRLRARWPSDKKVRWRVGAAFADAPKVSSADGKTEFLVDVAAPKAWRPPSGAPLRYQLGGLYEFSSFQSWQDVSSRFSQLYTPARSVDEGSPLKAEVAKIRAATSDQRAQALAALALVQNSVRYVALTMAEGNYTPASADQTWERRFGDCKGKTALLLALLDQLGISAEPMLVSATLGDGMNERLPRAGAFNHVIVHATIGGISYWLDGTNVGDSDLAPLRNSWFGWGLPLRPNGAELMALPNPPLDKPEDDSRLTLDLAAGLDRPAAAHAEVIMRGAVANIWKIALENAAPADRERMLNEFWQEQYAILKTTKVSQHFNAVTNEQHISADGVATLDWRGGEKGASKFYQVEGSILGWDVNLTRLSGEDTKAPYAVSHPTYSTETITIKLPNNGAGYGFTGANFSTTLGGITFTRSARREGGTITMQTVTRSVAQEFPASEADTVAKGMRDLASNALFVRAPANEAAVKADIYSGARARMAAGAAADALSELTKAIAANPKQATPLMLRAAYYGYIGDIENAKKDFEQARLLDPDAKGLGGLEGQIAASEGRFADSVAAYTRELAKFQEAGGYLARAHAHYGLRENEKALADAAEALRLDPSMFDPRKLRVDILRSMGQSDRALAELNEAGVTRPNDANIFVLKGALLAAMSRKSEALVAYDKAVAILPSAYAYVNRSHVREDDAAKLDDLSSALAIEPDYKDALGLRAEIYASQGKLDAALSDANAAIGNDPISPFFGTRARVYIKKGQSDLAAQDFAALRKSSANNATALNTLCWSQATTGMFLDAALTDCDAALRLSPDHPAYLDSRAFVLLRLGRLDEAIAIYDTVLAKQEIAASFYGRGIAKLRKGAKDEGAKDLAEARKLYEGVDKTFATYGVTP
jgi:tetratricopeptide (TPR) repeat protein